MTPFFSRCALVALPLLPLATAEAAFNPALVAADARWVVYADLNSLRATTLGKELVSAIEKAQSQATGGTIGVDVSKLLATVGALTAYGTNLSADPNAVDGALIAQGTADLRKIAESVLLQGTLAEPEVFSEVKDLPFPAYAMTDPKAPEAKRMQVIIAFPPEPIVIVSKSKAQLVKARDVFRGSAPSMVKGTSSPLAQLTTKVESAYLLAATVVPAQSIFPENAPQARMLQLANSGAIALGERGPDTFAHIELLATSDQNAEKLSKILQGMPAFLSLVISDNRQLSEFLNSTGVSREKDRVSLDLAYSSEKLVQMTQAFRAQMEARPANRPPTITVGKAIAEWGADGVVAPSGTYTGDPLVQTVENVTIPSGGTVTVGRALNGGKNARFVSVEVVPAEGGGSPLVFKTEFMRNFRGNMWQFQFPGVAGTYHLKVTYVPDPEGKTKFAVSVRNPKDAETPTPPPHAPVAPQPKSNK